MFLKFRTAPTPSNTPTRLTLDALLAQDSAPPASDASQAQDAAGCGWFESSHDLGQGLQVTEHEGFEWLDEGLPLSAWLQ